MSDIRRVFALKGRGHKAWRLQPQEQMYYLPMHSEGVQEIPSPLQGVGDGGCPCPGVKTARLYASALSGLKRANHVPQRDA